MGLSDLRKSAEARVRSWSGTSRVKKNTYNVWNRSPSSAERSADPKHAANRIWEGYFVPQMLQAAFRLDPGVEVFTMGSCFAREIEWALRKHGFRISSMPADELNGSWFLDEAGKPSVGFFHRYNVPSMELEFRRAVGDIAFDEAVDLVIESGGGTYYDLNYGPTLPRGGLDVLLARRQSARRMVANFVRARLIIVTLGLTEAWFHRPSGMYCNSVVGESLVRRKDEFEFHFIGFEQNLAALTRLYECVERHHVTGDFNFVVTVSPVPLNQTFTDCDIVLANAQAKATLRAVAGEFCAGRRRAVYFPSYEIAMYSDPSLVWRPDRIHIQPECVKHIVGTFTRHYTTAASGD